MMELADLMRILREAQNEERKRGALTQGACDAAGILAVVAALRKRVADDNKEARMS
jgi:hypothetical protein